MLSFSNSKRILLALGLAGVVGALSTTSASAGFHFGGGHFGGFHMAGPRLAMPRMATPRFNAPRFHAARIGGGFHQRQAGGLVRPLGRHVAALHHVPRVPHDPKIKIGHHRPGCRRGNCWAPAIPVALSAPAYVAPVTPAYEPTPTPVRTVYQAPAPAPVVEKAPEPAAPAKICTAGGTYLVIGFKPNASVAAVASFLKEYDIVVTDGPNADGAFRVRLSSETVSLEKFGPMIESMKTKEIVASIAG